VEICLKISFFFSWSRVCSCRRYSGTCSLTLYLPNESSRFSWNVSAYIPGCTALHFRISYF